MAFDNINTHDNSIDSNMVSHQTDGLSGLGMDADISPSPLSYEDLTRILLVSTMRPSITCQKTTSRACGYIIRPEIRFPRFTGRVAQYLESLGLIPRELYAKPEEINRILSITRGMDEFVPNHEGLMLVRALNGRLKQPKNHQEVLEALQMIEDARLSEPS